MTPDLVAAVGVSLLPLAYFLPAILRGAVLSPDDGTIFNTPLRVAAARITLDGHLPLWNPYIFGGMPLFASSQGGLLFPPNWFYLLFNAPTATNLMVVSSYMIAALGAYLYARRAGASVEGSVVTSLAWQWSGFTVGQIGHINIVQTAAMLPWVLWSLDGYALSGERKWGVLLAAFVALQAFVGHQQTLAYSLLLAAVYAVVLAFAEKKTRTRYLWSLALMGAGVLLAAVQILPTFELLRNSPRADATYDFFTSFSMPRAMAETFLAPYVFGGGDGRLFRAPYVGPPFYGELAGYVGVLCVMLALVAVALRRDARNLFWAAVTLVCLTLALGRFAPLNLYKLIYYVPILGLFRVPARHLMEVEFALAVLAGRGLTALSAARGDRRTLRRVAVVIGVVLLLTCLVVTWGRPDDFRLGREAPVSFLRAPELFFPVFVACASAWALWAFARGRRGATALLLAVLAFDLAVWGQSSGWRLSSPKSDDELFHTPETVRLLRERGPRDAASYRILTAPHTFDPAVAPVPPSVSHSTDWVLWTQPDVYMMHAVQNAAGYDGFGLMRYSRLAGDMKVWGELTDPDATLRGPGRAVDLLNVRYLISMRRKSDQEAANKTDDAKANDKNGANANAPSFPAATQKYGGMMFAEEDLGVTNVGAGKRLRFAVEPLEVERVALVTNLSWSESVPDGATVGRVRLTASDGRVFEFAMRAGADTAEWAYDRPDIRSRIRHRRATIATSYAVEDAQGKYEGHTYVTSFALPEKVAVTGGEIVAEASPKWPDLLISVFRVSLVDASAGKTYPLRREWVSVETVRTEAEAHTEASGQTNLNSTQDAQGSSQGEAESSRGTTELLNGETGSSNGVGAVGARWRLLAQTAYVDIYENARALPRAWLATEARALGEQETLEAIRTGRLPDGSKWEPRRTALVESESALATNSTGAAAADTANARAEVTRYEPNRVDVKTSAGAPSILVLSENQYPGWRAYLDGQSVGVLRVDYALRGVAVPAGAHEVRFVYVPKSVIIGLLVSAFAALALILWWMRLLPEERVARIVRRDRRKEETVVRQER